MADPAQHRALRTAVRHAVLTSGVTDAAVRRRALDGGDHADAGDPLSDLIRGIRDASADVNDAGVQALRKRTGSDKAAFEVVLAASIGAGLERWDAAAAVIDEVKGSDRASG